MRDTLNAKLVNVEIDRGKEVITASVPKHEVRVLRAVHGPEKVRETGDSDDELLLSTNADTEFARLQRKYARTNTADAALIAYPNGPAQLESFGFELNRGAQEAAPQSGIRIHKPEAAKPTKAEK
jgi:hypothetical protein